MSNPLNEIRRELGLTPVASTPWPAPDSVPGLAQVAAAGRTAAVLDGTYRLALAGLSILDLAVLLLHGIACDALAPYGGWRSWVLEVLSWPSPGAQVVLVAAGLLALLVVAAVTRGYTQMGDVASYALTAGVIVAVLGAVPSVVAVVVTLVVVVAVALLYLLTAAVIIAVVIGLLSGA